MRLIAIAALLPFFLAAPYAARQREPTARIDEVVEREMREQHIPGVSLAVIRDGQIALAKGYGLANVELNVPVKPETVFQSGSIGKQFTAAAVMTLVEEGKLSLDDPLTKFFPDAPKSWRAVTVRHVLTHTAGMTDYPDDFDLRRDYTEDEMLKIVEKIPLAYKPGERWSYSNLGYVTLGILIHKITGKFYGDVLRERIFGPLGMTTARIISEADIVPNRAAGYRLVNGELKNQEWVSPVVNTTADGSLYLTVLDMAKWDAALYGEKVLKRSSLDAIWTPVRLASGRAHPYGFGWRTSRARGHRVVYHGGAWQGFECFIVRFVDDRLTIVFFTNLKQADTWKLARGLAAVFFPDFSTAAVRPIDDKEPKVTERVSRALGRLAAGAVDSDLFTPEARAALSPDRVKQIGERLNSLTSPADDLSWEPVERREENGLRIYRYAFADLGTTLFATVSLTKDDKIADVAVSAE
jgi:CubicO group peptidase (beta-lactamase class C family)